MIVPKHFLINVKQIVPAGVLLELQYEGNEQELWLMVNDSVRITAEFDLEELDESY